ncbi:Microsomal glutathione S-transferase [Seminavis robusta]|uniref:Microsomal glutathione S-transferase n=1 Tax=Seminavis robusta TaxID=568900 RepID=A0A9N8E4B7_9STRA|nr:Microsomal glutathione S-transferase [Seminavis robusta]|eukprot:Sro643_g180360.1 Microsomal glutathione S-transferase (199) ;mRNA; f:38240-38836
MSHIMIISFAAAFTGAFLESKYEPSTLIGLDGVGPTGLPQAFGITPVILAGLSFWILIHGFLVVGAARNKYIELAEKDGEKEVKARYGMPNLYAQGTSKNALAFNCVQRSHQQIFETFPQTCLLSMVGAVHYPITIAATLTVYAIGRYTLSMCYAAADGDADKRYSSKLAPWTWYGYISTMVVAAVSGVSFLVGKAVL